MNSNIIYSRRKQVYTGFTAKKMSAKRKLSDDGDDDRGRSSRVRKKSAKVREMEEAEELERLEKKAWKKEQKSGTKRTSKSPATSPVKIAPVVESPSSPIKVKLNLVEPPAVKKVIKAVVTENIKPKVEVSKKKSSAAFLSALSSPLPKKSQSFASLPSTLPKKEAVATKSFHVEEASASNDDETMDDEEDDDEDDVEDEEEDVECRKYANTAAMALKVKTSAEKRAGKGKKVKDTKEKPKKKRSPSAYMLWCSSRRQKIVDDNPGIDFATVSKKLGELWQSVPEKEKMLWRRKVRQSVTKGTSMINTGKAKANLLNKGGVMPRISTLKLPDKEENIKEDKCSAIDVAAHLKLLGESLSIIGARLQEHQGKIAVQGSVSVLLDSLLCAIGPLLALTKQVPQLADCQPHATHCSTLDNIGYIMPGVG